MNEYMLLRQHRLTPVGLRELKSIALGLAALCDHPSATVNLVKEATIKARECQWCSDLFSTPPHKAIHSKGAFCSTSCTLSYDKWFLEVKKESKNI